MDQNNLIKTQKLNFESFEIVVIYHTTKNILDQIAPKMANLKWVMAIGTGVHSLLTSPAIKNNPSIIVTNLRSIASELLAEFTTMAILYFFKGMKAFQDSFDQGRLCNQNSVQKISGKKVLLVGTGSIGQEIGRKCKHGFDMRISGIKRDLTNTEHLKGLVDNVYSLDSLDEVVSDFDVVVASLPYLSEDVIFSENTFKRMKKGSVFVNVGRGSYVDETALIKYLLNDHLLGAGLDVIKNEPIQPENDFFDPKLKNKVLYTYHQVGRSKDLFEPLVQMIKENAENYLNGKELVRKVNKKLMY